MFAGHLLLVTKHCFALQLWNHKILIVFCFFLLLWELKQKQRVVFLVYFRFCVANAELLFHGVDLVWCYCVLVMLCYGVAVLLC